MNRDEAIDLAALLKGLMPRMTDELTKAACREIQDREPIAVQAAIQHYARTASDFVLAEFVKMLPAKPDAPVGVSATERTAARLAQERLLAAQLATERAEADRFIAELSDELLEAERQAVLAELAASKGPEVAAMWAAKNARTSRAMKDSIFARFKTCGALA